MKQTPVAPLLLLALAAALSAVAEPDQSAAAVVAGAAPGTPSSALSAELLAAKKKKNKNKSKNKKHKSFEIDCLAAHNKWRRLHQAPELAFDRKVAVFAQKRADFIAQSDGAEFRHPPDLPYGENLAWHSRNSTSCAELVKMWYDEVHMYDFRRGLFSHETGHFSQLVWRSSQKVGCARGISSAAKGGVYLVCNYDPPGNFLGEGVENVLPGPASESLPTTTGRSSTFAPPTSTTTTTTTTTTVAPTTPAASTEAATPTLSGDQGPKRPKKGHKKKRRNKKKDKKKGPAAGQNATTVAPPPTSTATALQPSTTLRAGL